jgi:hypothetical protein
MFSQSFNSNLSNERQIGLSKLLKRNTNVEMSSIIQD